MRSAVLATASVLCLILLTFTTAWPQTPRYFPLDHGNYREYVNSHSVGHRMETYPNGQDERWTLVRKRIEKDGSMEFDVHVRMAVDETGHVWMFGLLESDIQPRDPLLLIEAPLRIGNSWTWEMVYPGRGSQQHTFTCEAEEMIETPFGHFLCFRVRQRILGLGEDREILSWYNDGIGLIREMDALDVANWCLDDGILITSEEEPRGEMRAMY